MSAGPRPLSPEQALQLAYLAYTLARWNRILRACGGDQDQALRVWNEVCRAERVAA
jgi:hypothetical protein